MIDLTMNQENLKNTVELAKKRNVLIPTAKQALQKVCRLFTGRHDDLVANRISQ